MVSKSTIASVIFVGICFLLLIFVTLVVLSHWQSSVPLGERYELWRINSDEGWDLVVPRGNWLVERELVREVRRVGRTDDGYVVQRRDGVFFLVPESGVPVELTETERQHLLNRRISLWAPGSLRSIFVIRRYGWLFAAEVLLMVVSIFFVLRGERRRHQRPA